MEDAALREAGGSAAATACLGVIATVAPMVGLLGTVVGMILAFRVTSQAGTGKAELLAEGIYLALLRTAFGLLDRRALAAVRPLVQHPGRSLPAGDDRRVARDDSHVRRYGRVGRIQRRTASAPPNRWGESRHGRRLPCVCPSSSRSWKGST